VSRQDEQGVNHARVVGRKDERRSAAQRIDGFEIQPIGPDKSEPTRIYAKSGHYAEAPDSCA
jgi:hypothetical protein